MKNFNKTVRSFLSQNICIEKNDNPTEVAQKLSEVIATLRMQLNLLSFSSKQPPVENLTFFKHEESKSKFFCDPAPITQSNGSLLRGDDFTEGLDKMTGLVLIKRQLDYFNNLFLQKKSTTFNGNSRDLMWKENQHEKVLIACLFKISSDSIKKDWPGFIPCIDGARQLTKSQDKHALGEAVSYLRISDFSSAFAALWSNWKNDGNAGFGIFNLEMFEHFESIINSDSSIHDGIKKAFIWLNENLKESVLNHFNDESDDNSDDEGSDSDKQNSDSDKLNSDDEGSDSDKQNSDSDKLNSDDEGSDSDKLNSDDEGSDSDKQNSDSDKQNSDSDKQNSDSDEQDSDDEGSDSDEQSDSSNANPQKTIEEMVFEWIDNLNPKNYKTRIANRDLPIWEQEFNNKPLKNFEFGLIKPENITASKNVKAYLPKINAKYDFIIDKFSKLPVLDINLEEMVSKWRELNSNYQFGLVSVGSLSQDSFDLWKTNNRSAIEEVADSIYFPATEPQCPEYGYRSGDLDESKLWEIPVQFTDGRLFSLKDISGHEKVLAILLDSSGSMGNTGPKMREACEVVKLISEAVKELNVDGLKYSVYAHTGIISDKHHMIDFCSDKMPLDTEMTIVRVKDKEIDQVSSLMPITTGLDSRQQSSTFMPFVMTDNYDGFAIDYVIKDIKNQYPQVKNQNIHLIVVSDGQPSGRFYGSPDNAIAHTSEVIRSWQDSLVNIFGIGICNAMSPEIALYLYGHNNFTIIKDVVGSLPIMTEFIQRICAGE